ncbi:hypothetical protein [Phytohabitans rumicis]|uniref:Membrane transport protein MMPL domain-containing protein n=1 Tax=Phytohabitans rumicis TaxID=1076125 RepID=A0A6V8LMI7_9ACTN|nr:hypothetical protein [Phytohabitans rumicis]GFJ95317.1 hypothetical protein Prum_089590 [Phytohabitans rumicis]
MNEQSRIGPLGRLARLTYRRRGRTVLLWLAALALAIGLSAAFGGDFAADYSAPGSDSKAAEELLSERFPAQSGEIVNVVVRADAGVAGPAATSRSCSPTCRRCRTWRASTTRSARPAASPPTAVPWLRTCAWT